MLITVRYPLPDPGTPLCRTTFLIQAAVRIQRGIARRLPDARVIARFSYDPTDRVTAIPALSNEDHLLVDFYADEVMDDLLGEETT